jgi:DNA-binding beta-propeller fold protein YncE
MKKFYYTLLSIVLLIPTGLSAQKLEKIWEISDGLKTPESVIYNEETNLIYVANINGQPAEKDGNGFISVLTADGKMKKAEWVTGLNAPKGMAIFKNKLYVSDIDELVEIDIEKAAIVARYNAPGSIFLNDVTVTANGIVFASDNRAVKIYILNDTKLSVWKEGEPFKNPNGLFAEGEKLFVGDMNIYEVDLKTKATKILIEDGGGVDGLEKNEKGEFVFSNWPGRIFIQRGGQTIKLHDSVEKEINTADIDFATKLNLVLVPTFFNNKIVAYRIVD